MTAAVEPGKSNRGAGLAGAVNTSAVGGATRSGAGPLRGGAATAVLASSARLAHVSGAAAGAAPAIGGSAWGAGFGSATGANVLADKGC